MHSVLLKEIDGLVEGRLVKRVNRFVLEVDVDGRIAMAHLRDSGRLTELMKTNNRVLMRPKRREKTEFEIFVIYDDSIPVIVNSSIHSDIGAKVLEFTGYRILRREVRVGDSRIDLLVEKNLRKTFAEIKGCTLVKNGIALFPDAPTERGVKHIKKIAELGGIVLFLVMREDAEKMMPNAETHPEFAQALKEAVEQGVEVLSALLKPSVNDDRLEIRFERFITVIIPEI